MPSPPRQPWRAVFEGDEKQDFLAAVEEIAAAIAEPTPDMFPRLKLFGHQQLEGACFEAELAGGRGGMVLFFLYRSLARRPHRECDITERLLNQALEMLPMTPPHLGLYSGLPGVAWAATHSQDRLSTETAGDQCRQADEDPFAAVDRLLLRHLSAAQGERNFDLVSGLTGIGVYALERLPRPAAKDILLLVLEHLADLARAQATGIAWPTSPGQLPPEELPLPPTGRHDLGMAHGNAGVIGFLSAAGARGSADTHSLLAEAVAWMLAQRPIAGTRALFPYWTSPSLSNDRPSRMGWCYGAPGIAVSLLNAARCTGNSTWLTAALDLALNAAKVDRTSTRIHDAGLCHGAAGTGHLFNRMYQATGNEELGAAARFWLRTALAMRRPGCGTGGFLAYYPGEGSKDPWVKDAGLLTGAAGVGLAFLAAATDNEPQWDRILLASI